MPVKSLIKLLALGAIWGGSFLFMRVSAPVLGPVLLVQVRVGLAAVLLLAMALIRRKPLDWRTHWKHFLILGFFNTAFPFLLFSAGALVLPASLESVLNATVPIWGALMAAVWTRQMPSAKSLAGLGLGVIGVAILVGFNGVAMTPAVWWASAGGLLAAASYALAALYSKHARSVDAFSNAHGSMWAATLMLAPVTPFFPATAAPGLWVIVSMRCLGILCSGIAYILFFGLIDEIGAAPATTVTFLVPMFGTLWGVLLLHETPQVLSLAGAVFVLVGTALITGFNPAVLVRRKAVSVS